MHIHLRGLPALASLLLLGNSPLVFADAVADRAGLEAAAQAWVKALNARDDRALVALATEDVVLLDPTSAPVSGREAVRQAFPHAVGAAKGQVTSATKEAVIAGDVAWRIGALTHKLPNGDVLSRSQSLEIWKRVNGQWQLHRQMSSGILAQPKLLPRPSEPVLDAPRN